MSTIADSRIVFTQDVSGQFRSLLSGERTSDDYVKGTVEQEEVVEAKPIKIQSSGFKSTFKSISKAAEVEGDDMELDGDDDAARPADRNVNGEAVSAVRNRDESGRPLEDEDGEPLDDEDGEPMADEDGEPMDDEDGEPIEEREGGQMP